MKKQIYLQELKDLSKILKKSDNHSLLVVCTSSLLNSFFFDELKGMSKEIHTFTDFKPNPLYEDVEKGIQTLKKNHCDFIIALGGGSAIDVAKCIRAFSTMDVSENYLKQTIKENELSLLAIPTTAGTGSESTHFAVIYYEGTKYSVDAESVLPDYVYLEPRFLETLPLYQKKSTMLDALCQGIESYWSIHSTEESKKYAKKAIQIILKNYKEYLAGEKKTYPDILKAANFAGKAINISKTTAAHAMSYKITSLYGTSHGHAVALCLPLVWEYMIHHIDQVQDERGQSYLEQVFDDLDKLFHAKSHEESIRKMQKLYEEIDLPYKHMVKEQDLSILTSSVNAQRLKNNPIPLPENIIEQIYQTLV